MTFEEYKKKYDLINADLARLFKVKQCNVQHWLSGYCRPSYKNAVYIYKVTTGEITLEDMGLP